MKCPRCGGLIVITWQTLDGWEQAKYFSCLMCGRGYFETEKIPGSPEREVKTMDGAQSKRISLTDRLRILQMVFRDVPYKEVARVTGYSKPTVWRLKGIATIAGVMASRYLR